MGVRTPGTERAGRRLLVVGPLPPPPNGTSVSFQLFCQTLRGLPGSPELDVVDSSPTRLKEGRRGFVLDDLSQAIRTLGPYARKLRGAERVVIFGSNGFLLRMAPILLAMARLAGKPCYLRVFGGSLDRFCASLPAPLRQLLLGTLRRADGVLVQTRLLRDEFAERVPHLHLVPGYRHIPEPANRPDPPETAGRPLHLAFVGHVREEKGIFVLLDALRRLRSSATVPVHCDVFGPVYDAAADRLRRELAANPVAAYKGVLAPEDVVPTLAAYHALVLPTHYEGEGHPGVLIEAMMAGLPVITTAFRSIPEIVEDEQNGLLVSPEDPEGLARAIARLAADPGLLAGMAQRSWDRARQYDARKAVPEILRAIGRGDAAPGAVP